MRSAIVCFAVIALVSLMGTNVDAKTDIGLYGIGGKLGYVMPEGDIENTIGFGAIADLGTFTEVIHFSAFVDYWSKSYDIGAWDWSFREIIVGGTANYFFPVKSDIKPYAGGGLSLTMWKSESDYTGSEDPFNIDSSVSGTDLGFHVNGGIEKQFSPTWKGFVEGKYHISEGDFFGVFAGAIYMLGK